MVLGSLAIPYTLAFDCWVRSSEPTQPQYSTGALFGKGEGGVSGYALAIEQAIIMAHPELTAGLLKAGLEHDRRALRVIPEDFSWQFAADNQLKLAFRLPAGSYATGLLREIVDIRGD